MRKEFDVPVSAVLLALEFEFPMEIEQCRSVIVRSLVAGINPLDQVPEIVAGISVRDGGSLYVLFYQI